MKKKMLHYLIILLIILVSAFAAFLLIATITGFYPKREEVLHNKLQPQLCIPKQFNITSWNIGYCGLGEDADFFYDGGEMVRPKKEIVEKNLQAVKQFLSKNTSDFILLQELDINSKRSYGINELHSIAGSLPDYHKVFALNYKSGYVPIPVFSALGRVKGGLATFGRCLPYHAVRYAYPEHEVWPVSLFQLKRCFIANRYTAANGKDLVLINTHNSAYDNGKFRSIEMKMLRDFVEKEYAAGSYVIVAGDWNQTPPAYTKRATTKQYTPYPIAKDAMPEGWKWVYDKKVESMRFTNEPYVAGKTLTSTVDFFLISPNVKVLDITTHDLGFEHSDHNPLTAQLELLNF